MITTIPRRWRIVRWLTSKLDVSYERAMDRRFEKALGR